MPYISTIASKNLSVLAEVSTVAKHFKLWQKNVVLQELNAKKPVGLHPFTFQMVDGGQ